MNAVEIEQAISDLAAKPFDRAEFPYEFLAAFGNRETTIKRLRTGNTNKSDLPDGVLQRGNIHLATCDAGAVAATLAALEASPQTAKGKAKFILATDGAELQAKNLTNDDYKTCDYADFADEFYFFLPLANIFLVEPIDDKRIDKRATRRLNRLYMELLKRNPEWATDARRHDMNHFMARLIFCFFAEDTDIFLKNDMFTSTVERMSDDKSGNTGFVIGEIFRAMDTPPDKKESAKLPNWAKDFPYVNGNLFEGSHDVPEFTRTARNYLLHVGKLDWKEINPDIFGSMIQTVADEEERGALGMHYTSVPNILKVLNPLFLDDLRAQLEEAGHNSRKLGNLKKRMARIRVFDPACGSGNFLVIAYKEMRKIEAEINSRRREAHIKTEIPLNNFRGIEIKDFPAEIARLALVIAEFQCDALHRGQKDAVNDFLPLDSKNWIRHGNALKLDWLDICPPTDSKLQYAKEDLLDIPKQAVVDFENEGGETYICGNPPYLGSSWQDAEQKADLKAIFGHRTSKWKSLDYVAGWFMKAADYGTYTPTKSAFVSTNSICQGRIVHTLWPLIFGTKHEIFFAHTSFKWANLASHNAGVTVAIIGISSSEVYAKKIFSQNSEGKMTVAEAKNINAYLVDGLNVIVENENSHLTQVSSISLGNMPKDGGNLILNGVEKDALISESKKSAQFIKRYVGAEDMTNSRHRYCLWISEDKVKEASAIKSIRERGNAVEAMRLSSVAESTQAFAKKPLQFIQIQGVANSNAIVCPRVSSQNRDYIPVDLVGSNTIVGDSAYAFYDAPLWNMAIISSCLHLVWIATVCGKLKTDYRYSAKMGWNTFPVPDLTEEQKEALNQCAEGILLAREVHFPLTIADLYKPDKMPDNLRRAHDRNDETLERIYIGRRFKNDTERLQTLFDLYTKMIAKRAKIATERE